MQLIYPRWWENYNYYYPTKRLAVACIADTGIGMSIEDQQKLFRLDIHHKSLGTNTEIETDLRLIISKEFANANVAQTSIDIKKAKEANSILISLSLH